MKSWSSETIAMRNNLWDRGTPLAISPDDRYLASVCNDGAVRVHDLSSGQLIHVWPAHGNTVRHIDWSADQTFLATVGYDNALFIWEFPSGRLIDRLRVPQNTCLRWSPTESALAIGHHSLQFWSPENPVRSVENPANEFISAVDWSPDARTLALGGHERGTIYFWDVQSESVLHELDPLSKQQGKSLLNLAWSPNGKLLATSDVGGMVVWDPLDGTVVGTLERSYTGLAWSPDSSRVAHSIRVGDGHGFALSTANRSETVRTQAIPHSQFECEGLQWTNNGHHLAAITSSGRLCVFDMPLCELRFQLSYINNPSKSGTSLHVLSTNDNGLVWSTKLHDSDWGYPKSAWWDLESELRWVSQDEMPSWKVEASPQERLIAYGEEAAVSIIQGGETVMRLQLPDQVSAIAWSPDETQIAVAAGETVHVWNLLTRKKVRKLEGHAGGVSALAWSGTDELAAALPAGQILMWDIERERKRELEVGGDLAFTCLAFSPDGERLACCARYGHAVRVMDLASSRLQRSIAELHHLWSVSWSEDGETLNCVSANACVTTWDLSSNDLVPKTKINKTIPGGTLLSSDGRLMAVAHGSAAYLWDTQSQESLGTVVGLPGGRFIQISPSGHYFASADVSDAIVYCVETDAGERLTLSQQEFEERYGWKNDPEKARIQLPGE